MMLRDVCASGDFQVLWMNCERVNGNEVSNC